MPPDLANSLWVNQGLLAAAYAAVSALALALLVLRLVGRRPKRRTFADAVRDSLHARRDDGREAAEGPPAGGDRRRGTRRGGWVTPVEVAVGSGGAAEGAVVDRSAGGLCVATAAPVPVGKSVRLRAAGGPWVEAEVRNCRPHADYFLVGCRFRDALPLNVLLLFG